MASLKLSVAEREGFEPSIRFPVCRLSKAVPSASRPPLHLSWNPERVPNLPGAPSARPSAPGSRTGAPSARPSAPGSRTGASSARPSAPGSRTGASKARPSGDPRTGAPSAVEARPASIADADWGGSAARGAGGSPGARDKVAHERLFVCHSWPSGGGGIRTPGACARRFSRPLP